MKAEPFECPWCSDTIVVVGKGKAVRIIEVASDQMHRCWGTEIDYDNLLVTDDEPRVDSK